jgi:hypothetical protein
MMLLLGITRALLPALRDCGLLKFFWILGMRAQVRLLEYLVHMWYVDQQVFHVGVHTLSLDIEDVYFLTGLSRRGYHASLTDSRGGGLPMSEYCLSVLCSKGGKKQRKGGHLGGPGFDPSHYLVHHYSYSWEHYSTHGSLELFSVCHRVY